jgi:hypothetical protein
VQGGASARRPGDGEAAAQSLDAVGQPAQPVAAHGRCSADPIISDLDDEPVAVPLTETATSVAWECLAALASASLTRK